MKFRYGFVSNSSSASFVIDLSIIKSKKARKQIVHEIQSCPYKGFYGEIIDPEDFWDIRIEENVIYGGTDMDTYDFIHYVRTVFERTFCSIEVGEEEYKRCVVESYKGE